MRGWIAMFVCLAACGESSVTLIDPPVAPPTALRIHVLPDSEDVAAALALGWAAGIPAAEVTLTPNDSSAAPLRATADAMGVADFGLVAPGSYTADVARWLTAAEAQRLPLREDLLGWAWRDRVSVGRGSTEPLFVPASRRKSLVISEWAFNQKGGYDFGGFLELFNNADTTVYLDRIVVGSAFSLSSDFPNYPCSAYRGFRNDSAGVWTRRIAQLPGGGRDYPLLPQRTAVIATDAVDHAPYISDGLDLRQADFELQGTADVDNPQVPNAPSIGPNPGFFGHGIEFSILGEVTFLALPVTFDILSRMRDPITGDEYGRVPIEKLLDVLVIGPEFYTFPLCPNLVPRSIDRAWTFVREGGNEPREYRYSVSRRRVGQSGSPKLQHTRRSASDFIRTLRSPGRVP